jgi:hypothetical protein
MDRLSPPLTLIMSCHIRVTNERSGLVTCSHCADRVIGASNRKKRSVAIAAIWASTDGPLIRGTPPTRRGQWDKPMQLSWHSCLTSIVGLEEAMGALVDAHGFGKCLAVNMSLSVRDMADQI